MMKKILLVAALSLPFGSLAMTTDAPDDGGGITCQKKTTKKPAPKKTTKKPHL